MPSYSGMRCLVVDDEPRLRRVLVRLLEGEGFECAQAGSGVEALRELEQTPVPLVISDLRMPEMDGVALARELRTRDKALPLVLFSSLGRREAGDEERLLALLARLDARFRPVLPGRDLAPGPEHIAARGQLNLITSLGPLDVLCRLHDQRGYEELFAHSREIVDGDLRVRVIDLDTLIEIKRSTGRARDQMVVPILLALRAGPDET